MPYAKLAGAPGSVPRSIGVYVAAFTEQGAAEMEPKTAKLTATPKNFVFIASPLSTSCLQCMQAAITKWNDRAHKRPGFGRYLIRAAGPGLWNTAKDLLFAATSRERSRQIIAGGSH
jgi:hypothetical protein